MQTIKSLRVGGVALVLFAFLAGLVASGIWFKSNARWTAHLDQARYTGAVLYDSLQFGGEPPVGVAVSDMSEQDIALADAGRFEAISGAPRPAFVTNLSIRSNLSSERSSEPLTLAILSSDLQYPLASLSSGSVQTPAETLGGVAVLLATYCSNPLMFAKSGSGRWVRVEAARIWNCSAAPTDFRLLAAGLAMISIGVLATLVLNSSAQFLGFAQALRDRNRIGGPESYETEGAQELREIVSAVNGYLAVERDRLAERVAVLSGVSHDLGTPATRLKLRTELIADAELRAKLESDIDAMTGIIESVLTYTQSELDAEKPRQISLTSLIESIVADYQDVGSPVEFDGIEKVSVRGGQSIFMSRRGIGSLPEDDKVVVAARPVALSRAISNLIDNALKYGRRATVGLERDADQAVITVEDEGTSTSVQDIEELMAPFKRGINAQNIRGHGLGLTIVSTVANLHGGTLVFEPSSKGIVAKVSLKRK